VLVHREPDAHRWRIVARERGILEVFSTKVTRRIVDQRIACWSALFRGAPVDPAQIDREFLARADGDDDEQRTFRILRACARLAGQCSRMRQIVRASIAYWFSHLGIDGIVPDDSVEESGDLTGIIGAQLSWDEAVELVTGRRSIDRAAYERFLELLEAEIDPPGGEPGRVR